MTNIYTYLFVCCPQHQSRPYTASLDPPSIARPGSYIRLFLASSYSDTLLFLRVSVFAVTNYSIVPGSLWLQGTDNIFFGFGGRFRDFPYMTLLKRSRAGLSTQPEFIVSALKHTSWLIQWEKLKLLRIRCPLLWDGSSEGNTWKYTNLRQAWWKVSQQKNLRKNSKEMWDKVRRKQCHEPSKSECQRLQKGLVK